VENPQTRTNLSPRIDYQLTPNNTLTVRYQYFRDVATNAGVGQFNLPETGSDTLGLEHTFQATDTQIIGAHAVNESRFQFVHSDNENTPLQTGTTLDVAERSGETAAAASAPRTYKNATNTRTPRF